VRCRARLHELQGGLLHRLPRRRPARPRVLHGLPGGVAVWGHRMLTYRSTVGPEYERYKYGAAGPPFGDYDYDDADL
jgi:hypothetical protein